MIDEQFICSLLDSLCESVCILENLEIAQCDKIPWIQYQLDFGHQSQMSQIFIQNLVNLPRNLEKSRLILEKHVWTEA